MNVQVLQHNCFLFSYRCPAQEKSQCPCHWSIWITFGKSYFTGKKWLFQEKSKYLPSHISVNILNSIVVSTYIDETFFFFYAHISSILKVHNWETVNEREGKCYFSWITIFCCLEVCSRCLLAIMYLCECVCKLVFCAGDLSYVMYQLRAGVFFPTLVYKQHFSPWYPSSHYYISQIWSNLQRLKNK